MRPIMLATDGSPTAKEATTTAIELARQLGAELLVVSVWDIPYVGYGAMGVAPTPMSGELSWLGEDQAVGVVTEAAARAEEAGVETRTRVLRGFPVEEICQAARVASPKFLVLGSHGWGAMKRALFGSVSTGVLHHAPGPVLVVPAENRSGGASEAVREEVTA
jgi:nucleotide-binding universal stress UspA family protein